MALEVIGSGLGRTGTKSLQSALDRLGFGPCHHMSEVFAHPDSMQNWIDAGIGRADWDSIFANYRSAVDYPTAAYWRELTAFYPDAKLIHTVRDPQAWFESTQATIFAPDGPSERAMRSGEGLAGPFFQSFLGGLVEQMHDRDFLIDYFRRHTEEVEAAIPPERLLIYEAKQGWAPLCAFLGVPVPEEPYPSENTRSEFVERVRSSRGEVPSGS
jgi:hypothetical protein